MALGEGLEEGHLTLFLAFFSSEAGHSSAGCRHSLLTPGRHTLVSEEEGKKRESLLELAFPSHSLHELTNTNAFACRNVLLGAKHLLDTVHRPHSHRNITTREEGDFILSVGESTRHFITANPSLCRFLSSFSSKRLCSTCRA